MNYKETEKKYIAQTYKRQNAIFVKAKGKYIWDINGKKYLDFFTGVSVCNLGHNHPLIIKAIKKQADALVHVSNHYYTLPQINLAKMIIEKSFKKGKLFFSNSGAEAVETAIKIARKYGSVNAQYEVIAFNSSFHGRTYGALSSTGQEKLHQGFKPLVPGIKFAKFNDIVSVKKAFTKKTCAVLIEPIQGEGGVNIASKKFLQELSAFCKKNKILLIFDEVQCGLGRTGKLFAYQYYGVEPDIIVLAKSIANGLPLGITVINGKHQDLLQPGDHGSTFGGSLVACAAAIETLKCLDNKKLLANVNSTGAYFLSKLNDLKKKYPAIIKEVRGVGLMIAVELYTDGSGIVAKALEKGLIINCTQGKIIRFLPSFHITKKDVDTALKVVDSILSEI